jgi:hypothetical protein
MAYEQPRYEVTQRFPGFELRDYAPFVVAETEVEASHAEAGNKGFRRLAGYIFGKNKGARRIAMTAPVAEARASKIAMTAPVAEVATGEPDHFLIQFMMPSDLTLDTLPLPLDERIHFRQVPARRVAAIRYSGTWSERRYRSHLDKLRSALGREHLESVGEPVWARYDPPFKPWFLRRNEILIEVRPAGGPRDASS